MTMETRRDERIHKLTQALKRTDKLHLKDAAQLLGVSEMTVRRDLTEPGSSVVLLGGYIVSDAKVMPATILSAISMARMPPESSDWHRRPPA